MIYIEKHNDLTLSYRLFRKCVNDMQYVISLLLGI